MTKLAFFVEGQTEKIFIEKFLNNYIGEEKINFINPNNIAELYRQLKALEINNSEKNKHDILIYDVSGNDDTVVSKICDVGRICLEKSGFDRIFAICDLYRENRTKEDKQKILDNLNKTMDLMWFRLEENLIDKIKDKITANQLSGLNQLINKSYPEEKLINKINKIKIHKSISKILLDEIMQNRNKFADRIILILAVMETEAWFLAEHNLFSKIDPLLTPEYIKQELKKDLVKDDPEEDYDKPAILIKDIYELANKKYKKRYGDSCKIAEKIDYGYLCEGTRGKKIAAFHSLVNELEKVLN